MSRLLKVGLVSLLAATGGLGPSAPNSLLCAAEFDEFDDLDLDDEPTASSAASDGGRDAAVGVAGVDEGDDEFAKAAAGSGGGAPAQPDDDDEFSSTSSSSSSGSSSSAASSRKSTGKRKAKKKRAKVPPAAAPASTVEKGAASGASGGDSAGPAAAASQPDQPASYLYEYIALSTVAAYIVNFFLGKRANERKATAWANRYASNFRDNFYEVGHLSGEDLDIVVDGQYCDVLLTKFSQNEFKLYATGNDTCPGVYADLKLKPRQELISVVRAMLEPVEDLVQLDIAFEDNMAEQFVLAVVPARRLTATLGEFQDLETYGKPVKKSRPKGLPESLVVLSDCVEAVRTLLTPSVCAALSKCEGHFRRLHISDGLPAGSNTALSRRRMVLEMALPSSTRKFEGAGIDGITTAFFEIAGSVARLRLSAAGREKLQASRRKILEGKMKQDHVTREEQMQQRQDDRAKRKKEIYDKLSPAQKKKWAEKEEKKRLKKEKKRALQQSQMRIKFR